MNTRNLHSNKNKTDIRLHFLSVLLVVISGLNWGAIGLFGRNFIATFVKNQTIQNAIYILTGAAAVFLLMRRDAFLPFLSFGVLPCNVLSQRQPEDFDTTIEIPATPGTMVVYWAAERPDNTGVMKMAKEAYGKYHNSGVAISGPTGYAFARIRIPQSYLVSKFGFTTQRLDPHVHYRLCNPDSGKISEVFTKFL